MNKIIGITFRYWTSSSNNEFMGVRSTYIKAVEDMGAVPIIIPNTAHLEDILKKCDGIISIGGDDIDPKYYNQNNDLNQSKDVDTRLDEYDNKIMNYCSNHNIPLLGICRGMQCMAAFLGGSLHQDMKDCNISHPLENEHEHYVTKINDFGLAKLLPVRFLVNSYHHQVVSNPPKDFIILFKNGDAIESIESTTKPIIGVQWHPERHDTNESKIIFNYFMEKVNEGKNH